MQKEFVEPSWFVRFVVTPTLILWIVACEFYFVDALRSYINALPVCEQNQWLRGLSIALAICMALPSLELARYALRTFQTDQFPPPGMWVMRRTLVRRGEQAIKIARTLTTLALINVIITGLAAYFISKTAHFAPVNQAQCAAHQTLN